MKPIIIIISFAFLSIAAIAWADQDKNADNAGIRQAALDYAEGWYTGDASRMERALHPDLAKRIVVTNPQNGRSRLKHMSALELVQSTQGGWGKKTPKARQLKTVTILDHDGDVASVKLVMSDWIDYLHVARWNGEWKIINVLWERTPSTR